MKDILTTKQRMSNISDKQEVNWTGLIVNIICWGSIGLMILTALRW